MHGCEDQCGSGRLLTAEMVAFIKMYNDLAVQKDLAFVFQGEWLARSVGRQALQVRDASSLKCFFKIVHCFFLEFKTEENFGG